MEAHRVSLKISQKLSLPLKFLSLRKVVFGGSGSGKTSCGRVVFEEATAAGVLCGAIDLKGDFWGLKSTADGQGDGIPIVIFGGEHQDVPLDEAGGTSLADIVVELRQPFVVDLEELSKGKQLRFLGAFFERLYDRNREPLVLICDEADRYAPQKPMSPEANVCLGATEDIAKRGRKHGIFPVFITQRNASLNKGVSELCDVAIVFRTPGPRDQAAVEDWFGTKATREQRDEVMGKLAGLPTGTAILCSAHPDMKLFETVAVRQPKTFDSSATPEIGKRRIEPKRLAKPDLDELTKRMAATIERAKAEDPRELRRQLAQERQARLEVQHALDAMKAAPPKGREKRVEVPVLASAMAKRLESGLAKLEKLGRKEEEAAEYLSKTWHHLEDLGKSILEALRAATEAPGHKYGLIEEVEGRTFALQKRQDVPSVARGALRVVSSEAVSMGRSSGRDPKTRILQSLLWWQAAGIPEPSRYQTAFVAGYSVNGHFNNLLGSMRTEGLIDYPGGGQVGLTPSGHKAALSAGGPVETPSRDGLIDRVRAVLHNEPKRRIFDALVHAGVAMSREDLANKSGYSVNGHFNNVLGSLRSLGVIRYPAGGMVSLDTIFEALD